MNIFVNDFMQKFTDTFNVHTNIEFTLEYKITLVFKMPQSNICYCKEK